jgi:hypothetical protein
LRVRFPSLSTWLVARPCSTSFFGSEYSSRSDYWPAGHTILVEEAVRMVEFSPTDQMSQVLAHVVSKL